MAEPPEDRKPDFSNFPRGAIGIKGLPVSRNARLPSIRTPRDLMLGAQLKRTFTPNIPVRREKRPTDQGKDTGHSSFENNIKSERKVFTPKIPDRGRGRGKNKGNIIQTEGSIFGDGIAASTISARGKHRESIQRSGVSSERKLPAKIGKEVKMTAMIQEMNRLMRDDFIDNGEDDDDKPGDAKPIIFPIPEEKKEDYTVISKVKTEMADAFSNHDFAKEMGFDVTKIAKFIKKEKSEEVPENITSTPMANLPETKVTEILKSVTPQLLLLRFPPCLTPHIIECQQKGYSNPNASSNDQKITAGNLSSLSEGQIGKFQVMKSGRARLVIGSLSYVLDSVSSMKSKHEVVSIKTDSDSGDITLLGNVNKKLNFAPDIENLLS